MISVYSHIPLLLVIIYDNGSMGKNHRSHKLASGTGFLYKKFGHTASKSGRQTPIWKKGTIATEPDENYFDNIFGRAFLVDGITHEGMSGSPVIACKRNNIINGIFPNYTHLSNAYAFIGVYSAHMNFDREKKENTYLGLVWSKELIDEIIDNHQLDSFIP
ncbi:hypothetical protein LQZ19_16300 [Treponema primitia]|uniref:hypothetical protein n=1 Tax=Treponema primitia TaxID=88058 RepID=UPI00397FAD8B